MSIEIKFRAVSSVENEQPLLAAISQIKEHCPTIEFRWGERYGDGILTIKDKMSFQQQENFLYDPRKEDWYDLDLPLSKIAAYSLPRGKSGGGGCMGSKSPFTGEKE